jgi:hypothetical protein
LRALSLCGARGSTLGALEAACRSSAGVLDVLHSLAEDGQVYCQRDMWFLL